MDEYSLVTGFIMGRRAALRGGGRKAGLVMDVMAEEAASPVMRTTATPHFPCPEVTYHILNTLYYNISSHNNYKQFLLSLE